MSQQFYTNEEISLEKEIDSTINPATSSEFIEEIYEIGRCCQWIKDNNFKSVCLQFPDSLLPDSSEVAFQLQQRLGQTVYILADTAYGSCCIDYVAAAHINADAIIHFGPICFSKTSANIPYLSIYEKGELNICQLEECLKKVNENGQEELLILLDAPFIHHFENIKERMPNLQIEKIDNKDINLTNKSVVFIGGTNYDRKLLNLNITFKPKELFSYIEDRNPKLVKYEQDAKILRRRYFLIEKIKDSQTFGIVIGTLGVKNYMDAINRIRKLINLHKKKYYMISVGKPTVAKLANFPEIDIYVVVTCALNEIYESRDFYKPIVTMYDIEIALNPNSENSNFSYDYSKFIETPIPDSVEIHTDVSLLSGNLRGQSNVETVGEIVVKEAGVVALNTSYGAGFLEARSWKGLERNLGNTEIKLVEEGRCGIAQKYNDEAG